MSHRVAIETSQRDPVDVTPPGGVQRELKRRMGGHGTEARSPFNRGDNERFGRPCLRGCSRPLGTMLGRLACQLEGAEEEYPEGTRVSATEATGREEYGTKGTPLRTELLEEPAIEGLGTLH